MRWVNRTLAVAALAALAGGCGNYSTEDVKFLSALPRAQDLRVQVPAQSAPPAGALVSTAGYSLACPTGTTSGEATVWQWAKPTSDGLNAGVDFVVGLIDAVRHYTPTVRHEDFRRWGPFDSDKHPGREIQVLIARTWPAGKDGPPAWSYRFEARVKGTPTWTALITGDYTGPSSSRGDGTVHLDFDAFWAIGMNDAGTPTGSMAIVYSRSSDPVTTTLDLASTPAGGFGVVDFNYVYASYASGVGAFDYKFRNAAGDLFVVQTGYDAARAGRLRVTLTRKWDGAVGTFDQCWDAAGCLVYVNDPGNFSCAPAAAPCSYPMPLNASACPTLPVGVGPF